MEAASALMRATWPAPSLDYSPELLQWQLTFPGPTPPLVVTGWRDDHCVAFAAATPRRVAVGSWSGPVMVKSFMTVSRAMAGLGVGRRLRREIVGAIASRELPALRFGEHAAAFDDVLTEDYGAAGMTLRMLAGCQSAATLAASDPPDRLSVDEYLAFAGQRTERATIRSDADADTMAHYLRDSRGRVLLGVRDPSGALVASAMGVRAVIVARRGPEVNVHLEQLSVASGATAEHVRRLAGSAAHWGHGGTRGVVSIPNIGDTPWPLLAEAGFRKLPSRFSVWAASTDASHPLMSATAVNLEII